MATVKGFIPTNPSTGDPDSYFMKSWFKQVRSFCYGAFAVSVVQTAAFALRDAAFYPVDTTAGAVTASLPPALGIPGKKYTVKKYAGGNNITVAANGTDTVEGAATYTIATLGSSVCFVSDGYSKWYIEAVGGSGGTFTSPLTTKGDIYVRNATVDTRLAVGTNGKALIADSTAATGLAWATATGITAAGSDTHIQFNDGGVFGAEADLTWNKTTNTLTLGNSGRISGLMGGSGTRDTHIQIQNSLANALTVLSVIPNGTSTTSYGRWYNNSNPEAVGGVNLLQLGQISTISIVDATVYNGATQGTLEFRIGGTASLTGLANGNWTAANQVGIGAAVGDGRLLCYQPSGAAPTASGSSESTLIMRAQNGSYVMDFGGNGTTGAWIQSRLGSNFATNYPLLLNINGGDVMTGDDLVIPKTTNIGIKVDTASPTFGYRDIIGELNVKSAGASDPTWSTFRGVIKAWEFSASSEKELWIVYHVPHDYVPGTDIYFHVHWANAAAVPNTGNVVWGFDYSYAKGYNQQAFPATSTVTVTQACPATQYQHNIAETAAVTISGMEIDGLILCRVYRKAADAADTCTDTSFLFTADIHYQSTNIGTKAKNGPAFYT